MNKLYVPARSASSYYRMGGNYTGKVQNLTQFYHPLDMLGEWNRAYGSNGFLQYQFVVPTEAVEEFKRSSRHPGVGPLLVPQRVQAVRQRATRHR